MSSHDLLFHSFCESPSCTFSFQDVDEQILLGLREHPITLLSTAISLSIMSALPFILANYIATFPFSSEQIIFIVVFYYGILLSLGLAKLFSWHFNVGLITTKRVVDIDSANLLNSHTTATLIGLIEEVDNKSAGILTALFDYGNIFVQTAGNEPNIEFLRVPYPSRVIKLLNDLMKKSHEH